MGGSSRTPGREPAATRTAASSSGGIVLEEDIGLRGARRRGRGRRQNRWKKWCAGGEGGGGGKEDVVLFVVHGQYFLVALKEEIRRRTVQGELSLPLSPFLSLSLFFSRGHVEFRRLVARARSTRRREPGSVSRRTARRKHALRDRRLLISAGETPRAFPISRSRHANFRPHRSFVAASRRFASRTLRSIRARSCPRRTCVYLHISSFSVFLFLLLFLSFPLLLNHPRSVALSSLPCQMC